MATAAANHSSDLRSSLEAHDAAFTQLLGLIPAKYYIAVDDEEADSRWMKNKKKRPAEEMKELRKKGKLEKMDPANHKTIPEIQAERAAASAGIKDAEQSSSSTAPASSLTPMAAPASISVLRQKLQDKLDSFKRRKQPPAVAALTPSDGAIGGGSDDDEADDDDENMTAHSRDEMIEETRRRRGEVRDKRRAKRKAERKEEKEGKGKKVVKTGKAEEGKGKGKEDFKAKPGKTSLLVDPLPNTTTPSSSKPILESNLSFGTLALPSSSTSSSKTHIKSISNPVQALAHLQNRASKLSEMDDEKRQEIEKKEMWAKALERAEGGKVRDDEGRLKKAAKRVEKQKSKSGQEWNDRKKAAHASQAIKLKKRNENINSRSEARKNKKMGLKPKGDKDKKSKGKDSGPKKYQGKNFRPGFEGGRPVGGGGGAKK